MLATIDYYKLPPPIRRGLGRHCRGNGKRRVHKLFRPPHGELK